MNYDIKNIGIHLEISSNCNSRCLDCQRYIPATDIVNPNIDIGKKGLVDMNMIENIFDDHICQNARYLNLTGTYGDFITHPDVFEILFKIGKKITNFKDVRIKNDLRPNLILMAETNGGLHSTHWWRELATIINDFYDTSSNIIFGIDGINDEMHQLYRRGVNYNKVLENAKELSSNDVNTTWSMIVFEHNKDYIPEAEKLSIEYGFKKFKIRRSRNRFKNVDKYSIEKVKKKNISNSEIENYKSYNAATKVNDELNSVSCEWKNKNQISIDYTGRVWQCCYFSFFYHIRPINENQDNIKELSLLERKKSGLYYYEQNYDVNWNNVNYHYLSKILNHTFFINDLPNSISNNNSYPRIKQCEKHCSNIVQKNENQINIINEKLRGNL